MSKQLGEIIKRYRLERNLSVRGLASNMFLSPSTVSRWENGTREPNLDTLFLVAEQLRMDPSLLLEAKSENSNERVINIIVIMSDEKLQNDLVNVLKKLLPDHNIQGFFTLKEAVKFVKNNICDIAFVDLNSFGKRGVSIAKDLAKHSPTTNIIFLSESPDYMEEAWSLHASGYLLTMPDADMIKDELKHLRYPVWGLKL